MALFNDAVTVLRAPLVEDAYWQSRCGQVPVHCCRTGERWPRTPQSERRL